MPDRIAVQEALNAAGANAVAYSDLAWAAARKDSSGRDSWFPDCGAWSSKASLNSGEMISWVDDWVIVRDGERHD